MTAPDQYEFRVSPDRRQFAVWEPGNEPWFAPEAAMQGRWITSADMERLGWTRYVPESSVDQAAEITRLRGELAKALERNAAERCADRAAVLREAADIAEAQRQFEPAYGARESAQISENVGILRVAAELRRMVDETTATETTPQQQTDVDTLARMLSAADVEINHGDYPTWDTLAESGQGEYRKAARYLLKRLHITPRTTATAQQDGAQR